MTLEANKKGINGPSERHTPAHLLVLLGHYATNRGLPVVCGRERRLCRSAPSTARTVALCCESSTSHVATSPRGAHGPVRGKSTVPVSRRFGAIETVDSTDKGRNGTIARRSVHRLRCSHGRRLTKYLIQHTVANNRSKSARQKPETILADSRVITASAWPRRRPSRSTPARR